MNRLIFYVLRGGVILSIAIVLVGLLLLGAGRPMPSDGLHPFQLPAELAAGSPAGFFGLGVLVLILTPVARVVLSILYFARERDGTFAAITLAVFLILIAGVLIGLRPV